jgi:hypothetical protein
MQEDGVCSACKQGTLVQTTVRRMNGFLVVVGFILMIPAVIGVLIGGIGAAGGGLFASQANRTPEEIRAELKGLAVPDATIDHLLAGDPMTKEQLTGLNEQQQIAVGKATLAVLAKKAPAGAVVGGGLAIVAVSVLVGIVGWLFIRKKWVLLCTKCPAVVPAT